MTYPGGQSYSDPNTYDTCMGGTEGPNADGEGPCTATACQNATTQGPNGPVACPTDNPASGELCEYADGFCFQKGSRTAAGERRVDHGVVGRQPVLRRPVPERRPGLRRPVATSRHSLAERHEGTIRPPSSTSGRSRPTGNRIRRSSSSPTSAVRRPMRHHHRRGLHRPADQRAVLPVLVAQPAVRRAGVARATACVWNFGERPAEHHQRTSARTPSTARLTWRGTAAPIISAVQPNPEFAGRCSDLTASGPRG